jgi:hypothetical protein
MSENESYPTLEEELERVQGELRRAWERREIVRVERDSALESVEALRREAARLTSLVDGMVCVLAVNKITYLCTGKDKEAEPHGY